MNVMFVVCGTFYVYLIVSASIKYSDGCEDCIIFAETYCGYLYLFLALSFFVFGSLILYRLNKFFKEFYVDNKWIICAATMGLCCTCIINGLLGL
jgi:hypothetical protein